MEGKMPNAGNKLVIEMAPWTNGDAIRDMTDEELAEFFPTTASEFSCPPGSTNESCRNAGGWFNGCPKCWLDWLRQEVNDGKEEKEENQPAK